MKLLQQGLPYEKISKYNTEKERYLNELDSSPPSYTQPGYPDRGVSCCSKYEMKYDTLINRAPLSVCSEVFIPNCDF